MSLRIDTSEWIADAYIVGETGLGVLAEDIPSTGLDGASFLFNDLILPGDVGKEIRGLIVTPPSDGTFYAWEDGSFSLVGAADGEYTFTYRLFVDGVDGGTVESSITVGVESQSADISLGGRRPKARAQRLSYQEYDVPLPPEVLTSTIPHDTPPTGIKPAPSLSKLKPASKLATRPAKAKAPKVQTPAPVPAAAPEPQAVAAAVAPAVTAAAPMPAVAAPARPLMLSDILAAESMTNDEILRAMKVLARLHIGPQLRRGPAKLIRG